MFLGNIAAAWFGLAANHTCSVSETGKLEFVSGTDIPSARNWILEFFCGGPTFGLVVEPWNCCVPENQIFDRFTECKELDPGKLWQSDVWPG